MVSAKKLEGLLECYFRVSPEAQTAIVRYMQILACLQLVPCPEAKRISLELGERIKSHHILLSDCLDELHQMETEICRVIGIRHDPDISHYHNILKPVMKAAELKKRQMIRP